MAWSNQTQSARMAIVYITLGALIDVWTALYYFLMFKKMDDGRTDNELFWIAGFFFSGMALLIIGILVGRIGRAAGKAEVAPATTGPVTTTPNPALIVPTASLPVDNRSPQVAAAPVQHVGPVA